jgi:hypothetical protein
MKHIKTITTARADSFTDFMNAFWRAWIDFRYAKKNEINL